VLAVLVVSLRSELAQARAELERAQERIAELEARLRQTPRETPPSRRPVRDLPSRRRGLRAFQSAQATIARQWLTERL
jgi:hypothetical protein